MKNFILASMFAITAIAHGETEQTVGVAPAELTPAASQTTASNAWWNWFADTVNDYGQQARDWSIQTGGKLSEYGALLFKDIGERLDSTIKKIQGLPRTNVDGNTVATTGAAAVLEAAKAALDAVKDATQAGYTAATPYIEAAEQKVVELGNAASQYAQEQYPVAREWLIENATIAAHEAQRLAEVGAVKLGQAQAEETQVAANKLSELAAQLSDYLKELSTLSNQREIQLSDYEKEVLARHEQERAQEAAERAAQKTVSEKPQIAA